MRGPEAEARGKPLEIRLQRELGAHARLAGVAEPAPECRIADQRFQRRGERRYIVLCDQQPGAAVAYELWDGGDPRCHARERLALRLGEHVRQAVAVAVARDAAGERKKIRRPILSEELVLCEGAAPVNALGDAER